MFHGDTSNTLCMPKSHSIACQENSEGQSFQHTFYVCILLGIICCLVYA
jgi:hypothetical protein